MASRCWTLNSSAFRRSRLPENGQASSSQTSRSVGYIREVGALSKLGSAAHTTVLTLRRTKHNSSFSRHSRHLTDPDAANRKRYRTHRRGDAAKQVISSTSLTAFNAMSTIPFATCWRSPPILISRNCGVDVSSLFPDTDGLSDRLSGSIQWRHLRQGLTMRCNRPFCGLQLS